jgi:hypothetical protein
MVKREHRCAPSKPLPENQEWFEGELIRRFILANSGEVACVLKSQFARSVVIDRWGSGAGIYVDYKIEDRGPFLPKVLKNWVDGVSFSLSIFDPLRGERVSVPCDSMFHCHDGKISCLECFTYGEGLWPEDEYLVDWGR